MNNNTDIIHAIQNIAEHQAPVDFSQNLMNQIAHRNMQPSEITPNAQSVFSKIWKILTTPFEIRISPIVAAACSACLVLVLAGGYSMLPKASTALQHPLVQPAPVAESKATQTSAQAVSFKSKAALESKTIPVSFKLSLEDMNVSEVTVIGSFNNWNGNGLTMQRNAESGLWEATMHLAPGEYEYVYLIDGKTILSDPNALFYKDDEFGARNALIRVSEHEHAI